MDEPFRISSCASLNLLRLTPYASRAWSVTMTPFFLHPPAIETCMANVRHAHGPLTCILSPSEGERGG